MHIFTFLNCNIVTFKISSLQDNSSRVSATDSCNQSDPQVTSGPQTWIWIRVSASPVRALDLREVWDVVLHPERCGFPGWGPGSELTASDVLIKASDAASDLMRDESVSGFVAAEPTLSV